MGKGYGPRPAKVSGFSADGVRLQPIDISKIRSRLFLRMANSKAYKTLTAWRENFLTECDKRIGGTTSSDVGDRRFAAVTFSWRRPQKMDDDKRPQ